MFRFAKPALASLLLGASAFLIGCTADNKPPQSTLVPSTQGVTCSKCQVTWVTYPVHGDKMRIVRYDTRKSMECPDCKDAVANFFTTGKLQHTCKTCGDSMEICNSH
jgi:hypothetical protein